MMREIALISDHAYLSCGAPTSTPAARTFMWRRSRANSVGAGISSTQSMADDEGVAGQVEFIRSRPRSALRSFYGAGVGNR